MGAVIFALLILPLSVLAQYTPPSGASGAGVSSFNSRAGSVVLNSSDVAIALGYTPPAGLYCPGVVGDLVADDTAAVQACFNSARYKEVRFRWGWRMKITALISISNNYGLHALGETSMWDGPSLPAEAAAFYWAGADGGTMFSFDHVSNLLVEGLAFFSGTSYGIGTGGASQAILISQSNNNTSPVTTNLTFRRVSINGVQQNPAFAGVTFGSFANPANMEHMEIQDSSITCSFNTDYTTAVGSGILLNFTQNAQKHLYFHNTIRNCSAGITLAGGSADILFNQLQSNGTHIVVSQFLTTPIAIAHNDSENCKQFLTGPVNLAMMIYDNRISAAHPPNGAGILQFGNSAGIIRFVSNNFEQLTDIPLSGPGTGSVAVIILSANNFGNITLATLQAGLSTFSSAECSRDATATGICPIIMSRGVTDFFPPSAAYGYLDFKSKDAGGDYYKFVASENGGPLRSILPYVGLSTDLPPNGVCNVDPRDLGNVWFDTTSSTTVEKHCVRVSGSLAWKVVTLQ